MQVLFNLALEAIIGVENPMKYLPDDRDLSALTNVFLKRSNP